MYENNKSADQAIKDQIAKELGVDLMYINSALVSAQNRQRFYAFNWTVEQPEDRGIVLRDILESGNSFGARGEKGYALTASYGKGDAPDRILEKRQRTMVAEPIRIGDIGSTSQAHRVYSCDGKSVTINAGGGGQGGKTGLYAVPVCHTIPQAVKVRKYTCDIKELQTLLRESKKKLKLTNRQIADSLDRPQTEVEHWFRTDKCFSIPDETVWFELKKLLNMQTTEFDDFVTVFEEREGVFEKPARCYDVNGKMSTLMTGETDNVIVPIAYELSDEYFKGGADSSLIGMTTNGEGKYRNGSQPSQQYRVYSCEGKSQVVNTLANENYFVPFDDEPIWLDWDRKIRPIYEVKDGLITIKDKQYPIKLKDGYYIIRKLTPIECERLQTLPDNYTAAVSNAQRYKGLGNGWTAEVIIHILNGVLKDVPRDEEIVVLSMYDGIGTGRYCLDKMGFTNVKYYAYEKDPYPKKMAMSNYPDIIQCGDAFDLRHPDWTIGY